MPKVTRSQSKHFIIGHPAPLRKARLPTKGDVLNGYNGTTKRLMGMADKWLLLFFRELAEEVISVWESEGIPVQDVNYVTRRIKLECYDELKRANKRSINRRGGQFRSFQALFDIARCKCRVRERCDCPAEAKIPWDEWHFVKDQRGNRQLSLGARDRATSAARNARQQRREAHCRREQGPSGTQPTESSANAWSCSDSSGDEEAGEDDSD